MESSPVPTSAPQASTTEDNTVAILSYLTLLGFIIAIIMHGSKKTALGTFHLRQALGLVLVSIGGGFAIAILSFILGFIPYLGPVVVGLLWLAFSLGLLVLAVMGLIGAINRKMEPLPVVGPMFQKWFATAFN